MTKVGETGYHLPGVICEGLCRGDTEVVVSEHARLQKKARVHHTLGAQANEGQSTLGEAGGTVVTPSPTPGSLNVISRAPGTHSRIKGDAGHGSDLWLSCALFNHKGMAPAEPGFGNSSQIFIRKTDTINTVSL